MPSSSYLEEAYLHKKTAEAIKKSKPSIGFVSYRVLLMDAEEISKGRVLVDRTVFKLNKSDATHIIREIALSKLDKEEKQALGLNN